jgi:hypothetical protein
MVSRRTEAEQSFEHVRVPSDGDHGSWRTFCFGDQAAEEPQRQPTMPVLMAIDQVHTAVIAVLNHTQLQLLHSSNATAYWEQLSTAAAIATQMASLGQHFKCCHLCWCRYSAHVC